MSNTKPAPITNGLPPNPVGKVVAVGDYRKATAFATSHNSILDLPILTDIIVEPELPRLIRA